MGGRNLVRLERMANVARRYRQVAGAYTILIWSYNLKIKFTQTYLVEETVEAIVNGDPYNCLMTGEATKFLPLKRLTSNVEIDPDSIKVVK